GRARGGRAGGRGAGDGAEAGAAGSRARPRGSRGNTRQTTGTGPKAVSASGRARPRGSRPAVLAQAAGPDTVATGDGGAGPEARSRLDVRKTYKLFIGGA